MLGKHWRDTKGGAPFQCSQEWGAPFQCSQEWGAPFQCFPESDLDFHVEPKKLHMMVCLGRPSCGTRWFPRGSRGLILGSTGRGSPILGSTGRGRPILGSNGRGRPPFVSRQCFPNKCDIAPRTQLPLILPQSNHQTAPRNSASLCAAIVSLHYLTTYDNMYH